VDQFEPNVKVMGAAHGPDPSDAGVVAESLRRPDAFALLYDRYGDVLYSYAFRRVGAAADDLVSETFLIAFKRRATYDVERRDARAWLFGILTREISQHRRREKARYRAAARSVAQTVMDGLAEDVVARAAAQAARGLISRALAQLAARDRDVLLLVAWGQLSYEEVASALEIPVGTVRSRLNRARTQIRKALGADPTKVAEEGK
jgi:RNA polymerase sigma factor (sigma-70 family)